MTKQMFRWAGISCALASWISILVAQDISQLPQAILTKLLNSPPPNLTAPFAIITYPSTDPTTPSSVVSPCADGIFALVGLTPNQPVQVTIYYPASKALQLVNLEALDGGKMLPPDVPIQPAGVNTSVGHVGVDAMSSVISADGTLSFTFVATNDPGKNQISLRNGSEEVGLQFWVFDQEDPQNNPPAITASNPNPAASDE